jgi:hypothetical protein
MIPRWTDVHNASLTCTGRAIMLSSRLVLALLVTLFARAATSDEAASSLPPAKQATILLRALAYDTNLRARSGGIVNVAVLRKTGDSRSEAMAIAVTEAFKALESASVAGLPMKVATLSPGDMKLLDQAIANEGIDTIYVCDGLESEIPAIKTITRRRKVITMGSREQYLTQGLSLGVFALGGRNALELNLQASREEGAAFSTEIVGMARIIN